MIWVVITRQRGTYLVGETTGLLDENILVLKNPVLMYIEGNKVTFDHISMIEGDMQVNLSGQLGSGACADPYKTEYLKYLQIKSIAASAV